MQKILVLILLIGTTSVFAQDNKAIQKEIDHQLWKPFKKAFETNDGPALNSLYAEVVLRVTPNGIDIQNKFKEANLNRFEENRKTNTSVQLDFWFDSRHTNTTTSYEVGFYKMRLANPDDERIIYGQFHIVLKKINGNWQITQDWDTDKINEKPITAADFESQKPLKFE